MLIGTDSKQHYHNKLAHNVLIWCKNEKKSTYSQWAGDNLRDGAPDRITEGKILKMRGNTDQESTFGLDGGKRFRQIHKNVFKKF